MSSVKQQLVLGQIQANPKQSIYQSMIAAGFSHNTAKQPEKNLLSRASFKDLLEEAGVTDLKIAEVLRDGLNTPKPEVRHKYLETAIKVKGHVNPEPAPVTNQYNTFIQNNKIDPNAPSARELAESTLEILMQQTKRKVSNA